MKSILDPSFQYIASFDTDLSKTFARIRRDRRQDTENAERASEEARAKVVPIVRKRTSGE
jgi:hypothetical protein